MDQSPLNFGRADYFSSICITHGPYLLSIHMTREVTIKDLQDGRRIHHGPDSDLTTG